MIRTPRVFTARPPRPQQPSSPMRRRPERLGDPDRFSAGTDPNVNKARAPPQAPTTPAPGPPMPANNRNPARPAAPSATPAVASEGSSFNSLRSSSACAAALSNLDAAASPMRSTSCAMASSAAKAASAFSAAAFNESILSEPPSTAIARFVSSCQRERPPRPWRTRLTLDPSALYQQLSPWRPPRPARGSVRRSPFGLGRPCRGLGGGRAREGGVRGALGRVRRVLRVLDFPLERL